MNVAVGQRQASDALRVQRTEDLRDAASAVISDEIRLFHVQRIEKLLEHLCVCRDGHVLIARDVRLAVRQQVDGNAAPDVREVCQLMSPEVLIQQHAVHEQRNRPGALLGVCNAPRRCLNGLGIR